MLKKRLVLGAALLIGLAAGIIISAQLRIMPQAISEDIAGPDIQASALIGLKLDDAVVMVADTAGKAVVSISTERISRLPAARRMYLGKPFGEDSPFGGEDSFNKFFEDFFGDIPEREFRQRGLGSGVIFETNGYILTNEHVVADADKIMVTLSDGRSFKAELKGKDSRSDLAVIKIDAKSLPAAKLGDSASLKIGQWVVAIGNPFAFAMQNPEPTVTVGVISALHRSLGRTLAFDKDFNDLIQTDAAINPGNSGGPLVNLKGEVVGINVAIFSTSGGYQGVGFAIPVNNAKRIIERLIEGKRIVYGWLGVTVQDLNEELAKYFASSDNSGVLIADVLAGGPAEKAGLKEGDIIKKFDGKAINNVRELLDAVGKSDAGRKVTIFLLRNKKALSAEVEVGERPQDLEEKELGMPAVSGGWRGLQVKELSPELRQQLGLGEEGGVVISEVKPQSPADEAGLAESEVILEINREKINSLADYSRVINVIKGDALIHTARGYFIVKEE